MLNKFKQERADIDFLIALTHMRTKRDLILAKEVEGVDLILGGHDHHSVNHEINNILLKKSGTDFEEFTLINLSLQEKLKSDFIKFENIITEKDAHNLTKGVIIKDISDFSIKYKTMITEFEKVEITKEFARDLELHEKVKYFTKEIEERHKIICGYNGVDLSWKFTEIRFGETNIANMIADMMNYAWKTDCTIINTGTFRTDRHLPVGFYKIGDIMNLLPMVDQMVVMKVPGEKLHRLLENGVSAWPMYEGKFPAVSGIRFEFDPSKPSFKRILKNEILINGKTIDYEQEYTVAARKFITGGKDGYTAFKDCEMLTGEDEGFVIVNEYMKNLKLL